MNFLAHLYLSGTSGEIAIGNFIGDFVKGKAYENYPQQIAEGVILHREIDAFTDTHPVVSSCRKQLWDPFRHYSGVIMDLFFDHFLASQWKKFHPEPLEKFASQTYRLIENNSEYLPEAAMGMFPYMKRGNWLVSYAYVEGVNRALTGLSRRTTFRSGMENATEKLLSDYTFFDNAFSEFFPDLMNYVSERNEYFSLPDL